MKKLRGSRRSSGCEILALHKANSQPSRHGIERSAGTSSSTTNNKDIEWITFTSSHQRRLLRLSRRNNSVLVVNPLAEALEAGTAAVVVGGDGRIVEDDGASAGGGDGCSDGGAESSQASHGGEGEKARWRNVIELKRERLKSVEV